MTERCDGPTPLLDAFSCDDDTRLAQISWRPKEAQLYFTSDGIARQPLECGGHGGVRHSSLTLPVRNEHGETANLVVHAHRWISAPAATSRGAPLEDATPWIMLANAEQTLRVWVPYAENSALPPGRWQSLNATTVQVWAHSAAAPPYAADQVFDEIDISVDLWVPPPFMNLGEDCWNSACSHQSGYCPAFCGALGVCCRSGYNDVPECVGVGGPGHRCVAPAPSSPPSPPAPPVPPSPPIPPLPPPVQPPPNSPLATAFNTAPPFAPLSEGAVIVELPATVITFSLTIAGDVSTFEDRERQQLARVLEQALECNMPWCLLMLRWSSGSIRVDAQLVIPASAPDTVTSNVSTAVGELVVMPGVVTRGLR